MYYNVIYLQIDRASAANVKRSKEEIASDPEKEDDFGYTMSKSQFTCICMHYII